MRILCVCVWCSFTSGESERGDFLAVPKVLRGCSIVPFENSLPTNFYCNSEQLILNYFIWGAMAVEGIADRMRLRESSNFCYLKLKLQLQMFALLTNIVLIMMMMIHEILQ